MKIRILYYISVCIFIIMLFLAPKAIGGFFDFFGPDQPGEPYEPQTAARLLETSDYRLLETGDYRLLE